MYGATGEGAPAMSVGVPTFRRDKREADMYLRIKRFRLFVRLVDSITYIVPASLLVRSPPPYRIYCTHATYGLVGSNKWSRLQLK